ncbi:MAG TPA: acetamidase/formamidase family protein, partial [Bryobacteraceae bacterium]|nr:acetamidase/formamidase family protein [Bryobacteraceae bacterium]
MRNKWLEGWSYYGTAALSLLVACATTARAGDEPRQVFAREYFHTFAHNNAVLERIKPGEVIFTRTLDSGGQDEKSEHRSQPSNPLTGPFYVEGAEKGDAIVVHFRKVRLNRNWGYSVWRLALISLTPDSIESLYSDKYKPDLVRKGSQRLVPWDIDLARGMVRLREPESKRVRLEFPVHPMLGCVGVAAPGEFVPTSGPAGSYGGNLDYNQISEGAAVILPVYHPGALLFVGDGHALMADG